MPQSASNCVVLVPATVIEPECEASLQVLEQRGYEVRRVRGYSQVDVVRSTMATAALDDGFTETMWIDQDVIFDPDDVERLREHELPMCCGIYPHKGKRNLALKFLPETTECDFGENGGLTEIMYAATGFLHVRRPVYETIQRELELPLCTAQGQSLVPYFMPTTRLYNDKHWYLSEDFSFSERARLCQIRVMADTRIRLWHIGKYAYGWEDAEGVIGNAH